MHSINPKDILLKSTRNLIHPPKKFTRIYYQNSPMCTGSGILIELPLSFSLSQNSRLGTSGWERGEGGAPA